MKKPLMIIILIFYSFFSVGQNNDRGPKTPLNRETRFNFNNVYALVIGISKYQDRADKSQKVPDLNYADKDAQLYMTYLNEYCNHFAKNKPIVKKLLNEEATEEAINNKFQELKAKANAGDLVIIYFAGHGDFENLPKGVAGYLLCYDTPKNNIRKGWGMDFIDKDLSDMEKDKIKTIFIADACHAGMLETVDGVRRAKGFNESSIIYDKSIKLLSSDKEQVSSEDRSLCDGHGFFTYFLIKGLLGEADRNNNIKVTMNELKNYFGGEMYDRTRDINKTQTPTIICSDLEFPIGTREPNPSEALNCLLGKESKNNNITYVQSNTKEIDVFTELSSKQKSLHEQILLCLKNKQFFTPKNANAVELYEQLIREKLSATVLTKITFELQFAFKEFAQSLIQKYTENGKIPTYDEFEKGSDVMRKYLEDKSISQNDRKKYESIQVFLEAYAVHRKYSQSKLRMSGNEIDKIYEENIKRVETILRKNQSDVYWNDEAYLHNLLGRLYKVIGNQNKSKIEYSQAANLAPNWVFPKWNLISFEPNSEENIEKKIKKYKAINNQYPDFIDCYLSITQLNYSLKIPNYQESKNYLDRALAKAQELKEDSSMFSSIYNYYGILYENQKKNSEAENYYKLALSWSKGYYYTASRNLCDLIMYKENRLEDAFSVVNQSLRLHPNNSELLLQLGKLYDQKSKNYLAKKDTINANSNADKALANYLRSIELDSRFTDGYQSLIDYFYYRNKKTTLEYAKKTIEVASTESDKKYSKIYYAYLLWENKKDHIECLKVLDEVLNDMRQSLTKTPNSSITILSDNLVFTTDDITLIKERIKSNHYELYYVMGNLYQEGIGVPKNDAEAMKWYKWSLQSGFDPAASKIEKLYANNFPHTDNQVIRLTKNQNTKQFSVPCLVEGSTDKKNFKFFTNDYPDNEAEPIAEEIKRIKEIYHATVPTDVITSFDKLFKIARENNVSYGDLAEYALTPKPDDTKKQSETNNQKKDEYTTNINISTVEGKSKDDIILNLEREFINDVNKYKNDFQRGREKFIKNIVNATTFKEEVENYYKMGLLYETSPTDKSNGKAIKWYNYAFQMGYDLAYKRLSNLYTFISESKVDWLSKTKEKGFPAYTVNGTDAKGKSVKKTVYISEYPINPENPLEREQERLQDVYGVSINQIGIDFFKTHYNESQANKESFLDNVKGAVAQNSKKEDAEKPENIFEKGRQELLKAKPNFDVAIGYLKKAISLDNSKANYHFLHAYCLYAVKDYEQSEKSFKKAIELDPDRGQYYYYLGQLYIATIQYSKAQPVYEKAYIMGENKNNGLCYNLACIHSLEKRTYNALRFLEEALQNGFNDFEHIKKDADLDNIRNEDRFKELVAKYQKK